MPITNGTINCTNSTLNTTSWDFINSKNSTWTVNFTFVGMMDNETGKKKDYGNCGGYVP